MSSHAYRYTAKLTGKRVLILGGTSGIGFGVSEAAVEHGAQVVLSSSNPSKLSHAASRLQSTYPNETAKNPITFHSCDLSDSKNLENNLSSLFEDATASGKYKINHIVFTAGDALKIAPLSELNIEDIHRSGLVRYIAPCIIAKLIPKYVELNTENSFTITGGSNTWKPGPGWAIFSGWGGAVEGLARGLAVDLKPLRVNAISPGAVNTELFSGLPKDRLEKVLEFYRSTSTTGTVGTPQDLAEAYLYVMKDHFVTGSVVESNGGRLLV